jgi:hypothetical protein
MAWHASGQFIEICSCKLLCPCWFGPAEPDRGWCSGAITFDVQAGQVNDVNVDGRRVVWAFDFPKDFASGNGVGRVYIDEGATAEQQRELEALFTGKYGGPFAAASAIITKWLSTKVSQITIKRGSHPSVTVGDFGVANLQRFLDQAGRPTTVVNAPIHQAFQVESEDPARSDGSQWSDPDMRKWEAGGSGGVGAFSWKG